MDSPRSGSLRKSVELLDVETELFSLYIKGKPFHPTVESLGLHRDERHEWESATLEVVPNVRKIQLHQVQVFSPSHQKLVDFSGESAFPCFYENQDYQIIIEKKDVELELEFFHENVLLREAVTPLGRGGKTLSGVLNFQNDIGYTDLEIRLTGETLLQVRIEVFPSKIDYKKDYLQILDDVNEQIYNLAFDFMRKTYTKTGAADREQTQSMTEFWSILQMVFQRLVQAVDRIQTSPHHRLQKESRVVVADQVRRTGKENIAFLAKRPHLLVKDAYHGVISIGEDRYRPTKLMESKRRLDYDTVENRFLRFALLRISSRLKELRRRLAAAQGGWKQRAQLHYGEWLDRIDRMQNQLTRLLRMDFLQEVSTMQQMTITLVLQMAPGYREVYRDYLLLLKGLSLQGDLFRLSLKDVSQLYEYWCFLKIHSLLKEKYQLISQDIVRVNRNGLFVRLEKDRSASVTYRNPNNDERFTLYYNTSASTSNVPTLAQKPDNVLTIRKKGSLTKGSNPSEYKYIFDAKYRLNPALHDSPYQKSYHTPGPVEEDINTMHRYRDAIIHQQHGQFERSMFGAYVLFPYNNEEEFQEHHFYKSIKKVNVGALPFLPGSTTLMEQFLDELVMDSPEKAFERAILPRGTQQHFANHLSGKNMVIGALGEKEQLAICLEHNFYYMPLRHFKEQKLLSQLEWVGIYQSKHFFGEKKCGIRWVGRIREWNVVKRGQITESPVRRNNSDELYVRFEVEEWKQERTIEAGGSYVQYALFTTKYLFDRALEIAELRIEKDEELREWREKRRRGKVKVELDDVNVDMAGRVVSVEVE